MSLTFLPKNSSETPDIDRIAGAPHPREMLGLIGHKSQEQDVLESYHAGRLHHAFLLTGPEGIGKATFAYRIARFLLSESERDTGDALFGVPQAQTLDVPPQSRNAGLIAGEAHPDLAVLKRRYDAKTKKFRSEISIEDTRNALSLFSQTAAFGGWRVIIIDAADDLNASSANAILKTLEEPPQKALFLLISHQPQRLLPTIRSRCRKLDFHPLSDTEIDLALSQMPELDADAAHRAQSVARAQGSLRRAIRLLDPKMLGFVQQIETVLAHLPQKRGIEIDRLADATRSGPLAEQALADLIEVVESWLDQRLRQMTQNNVRGHKLADIGAFWARMGEQANRVDALNLDRRAFVVTLFDELAVL